MPDLTTLFPRLAGVDLAQYGDKILAVGFILLLASVLHFVNRRLIRLFKRFALRNSSSAEDQRRVETLSRVFRYVASVVIVVVTTMTVLSQVGISIAPILGAAGVIGVAIGFGAQSLVKDFFTGFVILLGNQIRQGDAVTIAGKTGVVESVTLRIVRLRGVDGNVHFVPTGMIDTVTNMSMEFSYALMDIGVAYREDVDEVYEVMRATAAQMREDSEFAARIIDDLDIMGVDQWADSAVVIRCRIKTVPLDQLKVRREYMRRLKAAFDAHGIEIPFPHVTVYAGQPRSGRAPAFPLEIEGATARPSGTPPGD
ncbi:MAG: mechanosensitive ion channel family protein [Burkholderiaceae bacterium]|nr:mechanosensitive ion channel family protein [Burkholderiaceae bacterium]